MKHAKCIYNLYTTDRVTLYSGQNCSVRKVSYITVKTEITVVYIINSQGKLSYDNVTYKLYKTFKRHTIKY